MVCLPPPDVPGPLDRTRPDRRVRWVVVVAKGCTEAFLTAHAMVANDRRRGGEVLSVDLLDYCE